MTTDTLTQVKNYNGNNSFVLKMKDAVKKYGSLTQNQKNAVEKILRSQRKQLSSQRNLQSNEGLFVLVV